MSRHYIAIKQRSFTSAAQGSIASVLGVLRTKRPALADRLSRVDWPAVKRQLARQALEATAAKFSLALGDTPVQPVADRNNDVAGSIPKGDCVGVLSYGGTEQLGLIMNGEELSFFTVGGDPDSAWSASGQAMKKWQAEIERAYNEAALGATLQLVGDKVEKTEREDGTVILETRVKGKT